MTENHQSIQAVDLSPPRAGRNFLCRAEKAENLIDQGPLALAPNTIGDVSSRNDSETRRVNTGNIRGICSVPVPPIPLPDCARHLARLYLKVPQEKRDFVSTLRQQLLAWDNGGNQDQLRKSILKRIDAIERVEAFNAEER